MKRLGKKMLKDNREDCHPPPGYINWWEDIGQEYGKGKLKQHLEHDILEEILDMEEEIEGKKMKHQIAKAGYTIEVTSWENDGDNYRSKEVTFDSLEEAKAVQRLCENVFISGFNGEGGIGNFMDDEREKSMSVVMDYVISSPDVNILIPGFNKSELADKIKAAWPEDFDGTETEARILEWAPDYMEDNTKEFEGYFDKIMSNYNWELMGGSEYYYSRVYERSVIYYSAEDLFLEII